MKQHETQYRLASCDAQRHFGACALSPTQYKLQLNSGPHSWLPGFFLLKLVTGRDHR